MDTKVHFNDDGSLDIAVPNELIETIKYGIYTSNAKRIYIDAYFDGNGNIDFKIVFTNSVDQKLYDILYNDVSEQMSEVEYMEYVDKVLDEYIQNNILPNILDIISEAALLNNEEYREGGIVNG
jgi:uncharacterized protein YpiB (UPF0302 family)